MRNLLIIEHEDIARDTLGSFSEKLGYKPILIFDPAVCNAVKSVGKYAPQRSLVLTFYSLIMIPLVLMA